MVAYSFKARFVNAIKAGLGRPVNDPYMPSPKLQTIRAIGKKCHARPSENMQLYHGLRTKLCFQIGIARCTSVSSIRIQVGLGIISVDDYPAIRDPDELAAFAQSDGFASWPDMQSFWQQEHGDIARLGPWTGLLIKWEPII